MQEEIELPFGILVKLDKKKKTAEIVRSNLFADDEDSFNEEHDAALNGIETLILAHAVAGVNIASKAYKQGLEQAVKKCDGRYGEVAKMH